MSYTGDVTVVAAWEGLAQDERATLIDVRTRAEWTYVGLCDLSGPGKSPLLVSWQLFPDMVVNPSFTAMVIAHNIPRDYPLYFLCRSGVRSRAAAAAMTAAGYEKCFNILGGFEGDPDEAGHRGGGNGWKAAGLPWRQS
ncbi:MAG: rhodanese-like domain-containing protein [Alphaproteobacteria bacterium]|nr:rhodanese-like domain-containing protein [Alphaproteobacteria bacterium]